MDRFGYDTIYTRATDARIIETVHAITGPRALPITDDMVAMVEDLRGTGYVPDTKPATFQTPHGLIVHPTIMDSVRKRLAYEMDRQLERAFFTARRSESSHG